MFDSKTYHREYQRKYRSLSFGTPEEAEKRRIKYNEYMRKYEARRRATDPDFVEKERARGRLLMRRKRQDPEYRKLCYKKRAEWGKKNRERLNEYQRKRNAKPENKIKQKARNLKNNFGLTLEEYNDRRSAQKELCPICTKPLGKAAVDHNHATGQVRDIIYTKCNLGVGFIENSSHLLKPMHDYLAKWNALALSPV